MGIRRTFGRVAWVAACFVLSACGLQKQTVTMGRTHASLEVSIASFSALQQNLIAPRCLSCHDAAVLSGGIDMSSYESLLASGAIVKGSPQSSQFYTAIQSGLMPPGGGVSADVVAAVYQWILAGAPKDVPLSLSSVSPATGSTTGSVLIKVAGSGFAPGLALTLGGLPCASVTVVSTQEASCLTPAHAAGRVTLSATLGSQSASLVGGFAYVVSANPAPVLTSISPVVGPTDGGTTVTLNGKNFLAGAAATLGDVPCTGVKIVSSMQATCVSGPHGSGAVDVLFTNPDGQSSRLAGAYTYQTAPTFASIQQSILQPQCVACHGAKGSAGVDYSSYATTLNTGSVVPGNAAASKLYLDVNSGAMPKGGTKLSPADIKAIFDWIQDGARDN
jgi:hypothetical protein